MVLIGYVFFPNFHLCTIGGNLFAEVECPFPPLPAFLSPSSLPPPPYPSLPLNPAGGAVSSPRGSGRARLPNAYRAF